MATAYARGKLLVDISSLATSLLYFLPGVTRKANPRLMLICELKGKLQINTCACPQAMITVRYCVDLLLFTSREHINMGGAAAAAAAEL